MKMLNTTLDARTQRLVKVITAYTLTEEVPVTTRRNLLAHVKGIRLLSEAGEMTAAGECVTALRNSLTEEIDTSVVDWRAIIIRHCDAVLSELKR